MLAKDWTICFRILGPCDQWMRTTLLRDRDERQDVCAFWNRPTVTLNTSQINGQGSQSSAEPSATYDDPVQKVPTLYLMKKSTTCKVSRLVPCCSSLRWWRGDSSTVMLLVPKKTSSVAKESGLPILLPLSFTSSAQITCRDSERNDQSFQPFCFLETCVSCVITFK